MKQNVFLFILLSATLLAPISGLFFEADSNSNSATLSVITSGWNEVGAGSASYGGISQNVGNSSHPSIAVDSNWVVYVAWDDDSSGNNEIYVKKWENNIWSDVGAESSMGGGISNNSGSSISPNISLASDGTPYIAWIDKTIGRYQLYVKRWDGAAWVEVGTGSASGTGVSNTGCNTFNSSNKIAVAPNGFIFVAWDDDCGNPEIYVKRWDGSAWQEVPTGSASGVGISNTPWYSYDPMVAVAPDNTPYITWMDEGRANDDFDVYIRRFIGSSWDEVGNGSASGTGITPPSDWSKNPWIAFMPSNTPYIAWQDKVSGNWEIFIKRWNNSSWEPVGLNAASGGGISNTPGDSYAPKLEIDLTGVPYVTWFDNSSGNREIYIRRWNGITWEEVGTGSATEGGISANLGESSSASLAIDPNRVPYVAWSDNSNGNFEIYVRRWRFDDEGPITSKVVVTSAFLNGPAILSATSDDITTGGSNIASAEYSLNSGIWTPMSSVDGDFDEVAEDVAADFAATKKGENTACVRSTDAHGNLGTETCQTFVVAYVFDGFFSPIEMNGVINSAKAGQTIPAKWYLTDYNGVPISTPDSFVRLYSFGVSCADFTGDPFESNEEYAPGSSDLQYNGNGYWKFNWKTPKSYAKTCRAMYVEFNDGTTSPIAYFHFRK